MSVLQGRQEHAGTASGEQWQMLWVAAIRAGKVAVSDQGQHHALHCMQGKAWQLRSCCMTASCWRSHAKLMLHGPDADIARGMVKW